MSPRGYPGTKAPHGTLSRYTRHRCRCGDCRAALRDYERAKYGYTPREDLPRAQHGTESKYNGSGCRCDECREAARVARATRARTTKRKR